MSRKSEKIGNGSKCETSVWIRAITARSSWPDKVCTLQQQIKQTNC